jgi:DNA-binding response OmpR family regulator
MKNKKILWIDDEIDLLKPHIIFLEQKGYEVFTSTNGEDGLDFLKTQVIDIIFLDENMPGVPGLEVLLQIKELRPTLPVVMITKSEEESIMEEAIGSKIDDYLIKPVNPNQILLCLKKNLEDKRLKDISATHQYQKEFRNISMEISSGLDFNQWKELYKKMIHWELNLQNTNDESLNQILQMQKEEANNVFSKYYISNYINWLKPNTEEKPVFSHTLLRNKVLPFTDTEETVFLIVIDNLRYDQWKVLQPIFEEYFYIENEDLFYSIIPSVTQYSRNAMFAGMMPSEIQKRYPNYWVEAEDEESKNYYERELLGEHLKRLGKQYKYSFNKILHLQAGKKLAEQISNLYSNKLNVIIYNFVDIISHAKTEMDIIKELADDEPAYRSLTLSWFKHSPLHDIIRSLAEKKARVILTTDHGSVLIKNPVKIIGDRETNTNLRFKFGRNLNYQSKEIYEIMNPSDIYLPRPNVSTSYVFCKNYDYLVYPNNYNHFVKYYNNTFQHGGISMEEILAPIVILKSK